MAIDAWKGWGYEDATCDGKYAYFTVEAKGGTGLQDQANAYKAVAEKTGAKWSELSIWPANQKAPWPERAFIPDKGSFAAALTKNPDATVKDWLNGDYDE